MNLATCGADAVRLPNLSREGLDKIVKVVNFHHLTDALKKGRGVILMTGHYGNWELLGTWLIEKSIPLRVVAKKSYDPRLDELIVGYRNSAGYSNTPRGGQRTVSFPGFKKGMSTGCCLISIPRSKASL